MTTRPVPADFLQTPNNPSNCDNFKKPRLEQDDRQPANIVQNFLSKGQQTTTYSIPNPVLTDSATQQLGPSQAFQRVLLQPSIRTYTADELLRGSPQSFTDNSMTAGFFSRPAPIQVPTQKVEGDSASVAGNPPQISFSIDSILETKSPKIQGGAASSNSGATQPTVPKVVGDSNARKELRPFEAWQQRQMGFRPLKTVEENATSLLREAERHASNKELPRAIKILEEALLNLELPVENRASGETNARLCKLLGHVLIYTGQHDAAIKTLRNGLTFQNVSKDTVANIYGVLGLAFTLKNELPTAADMYTSAICYGPNSSDIKAFFYFQLGEIHNRLGQRLKAIESFQQGLSLNCSPQLKADMITHLGMTWCEMEKIPEAITVFNAGSSIEGIDSEKKAYFLAKIAELSIKIAQNFLFKASNLSGLSENTKEQLAAKAKKLTDLTHETSRK